MSDFVVENGVLKQYAGSKRSVVVPEGVTEIAEDVFREGKEAVLDCGWCNGFRYKSFRKKGSLRSLILPSTLKVIRPNAFRGCSALCLVELPDGLEEISELAFFDCARLKEIKISPYNSTYETIDGVLFLKKEKKLICYPAGKTDKCYIIPESTVAVGSNAFSVTALLKEIHIPNSVLRIEDRAFVSPLPKVERYRDWVENMVFESIVVEPGGKKKQVGKDVFGFEAGKGPLCYPQLPVDFVKEKMIRDRLAMGFCSKPERYSEPYREVYENYVKNNRKSLMQKALRLKLDSVKKYFLDEAEESYETLSEQAKVELLEKIVLEGDRKKLESLLRVVPTFEFGARTLGYACLYAGAETTELLLNHGLTFQYKQTPYLSGKYKLSCRTASKSYYADYSLLAVYKGIDPRIDVLFGGERTFHFADLPIDQKRILPDEERLRCVRLLAEREVPGVKFPDLLYYSVLWGCHPVENFLREQGVSLPGWARFAVTRADYSVERGEFLAVLAGSPPEVAVRCLESLTEQLAADHHTIVLTMKMFDTNGNGWEKERKTCVWDDPVLSRIVRLTDTSRLTKGTLLNGAVEHNCLEALTAMEAAGWLKNPSVRDKLIETAQKNEYREALAWLLNFKNRTADIAAEEAAREKRELRSLNANPDSVSELKKKWLYAVNGEEHATIRSYKGEDIDVIVPRKIGKALVTEIGIEAFATYAYHTRMVKNSDTRKNLRSVCLPDTITSIEKAAFRGCENLESINIPDSVRRIGQRAFEGCRKLSEIEVSEKTRIHDSISGWKNADELEAFQYGPKVRVKKTNERAVQNESE